MPTLTLKNLPTEVYRRLKARAARHGRSLNDEVTACLRAAVSVEAVAVEALIAQARKQRATVHQPLRDSRVRALKHLGRP